MTLDTAWLVWASSGVYSDRREWVVAAYPSEDVARLHAKLAKEQCLEAQARLAALDKDMWELGEGETAKLVPLDPHITPYERLDNVQYGVVEVPLCMHTDQFMERRGL